MTTPQEIELVPARPEHAAILHIWRRERHSQQHNPVEDLTADQLAVRLGGCGSDLTKTEYTEYRWMVRTGGEFVGTVSAAPNRRMRYAEIGYQIGKAWQGRGIGRAAVRRLVDLIFDSGGVDRIIAYVAEENIASYRLIEGVGFIHEGTMREHYIIRGRRVNERVYGLLRHEWRKEQDTSG